MTNLLPLTCQNTYIAGYTQEPVLIISYYLFNIS